MKELAPFRHPKQRFHKIVTTHRESIWFSRPTCQTSCNIFVIVRSNQELFGANLNRQWMVAVLGCRLCLSLSCVLRNFFLTVTHEQRSRLDHLMKSGTFRERWHQLQSYWNDSLVVQSREFSCLQLLEFGAQKFQHCIWYVLFLWIVQNV